MISYRELLKKTAKIIESKRFKAYLFGLYKINRNIPPSNPISKDWLSMIESVAKQQVENRQLKRNDKIKHHNQHCVLGYYGFVFKEQELAHVECKQEIIKLFMRAQMYFLIQRGSQDKKHRLPIYPIIPDYHHAMFVRQIQENQKLLHLQFYNLAVKFSKKANSEKV